VHRRLQNKPNKGLISLWQHCAWWQDNHSVDDVFLYTVDDLQQVVDNNINNRNKEKTLAEEIIISENKKFTHWVAALPNEEVIQAYKKNAYQIKKSAVEMALKKLKNGGDAQTIIAQLGDQLTNKLLHTPFSNIKQKNAKQLNHCAFCIPKNKAKKS
jgi:glutamyl-tRNA reductase